MKGFLNGFTLAEVKELPSGDVSVKLTEMVKKEIDDKK